jgi:hypothetical protein
MEVVCEKMLTLIGLLAVPTSLIASFYLMDWMIAKGDNDRRKEEINRLEHENKVRRLKSRKREYTDENTKKKE